MKKPGLLLIFIMTALFSGIAQPNERIWIDDDIQLLPLQDSVYVHISWHQTAPFGRFSSNGMLLIRKGKALMIDTPMDNDKTQSLTAYLKDSMSVELTTLIIGHFHDDCMGGLSYLQEIGIESIANAMTIEKCKEIGLPLPSRSFSDSLTIDFFGEQVNCRYFGAGHSFDNITVWFPQMQLLFGGCLVKSMHSNGLGNLSDAVVDDWDTTLMKLMKAYPEMHTVIPGHGEIGGIELLDHTLELVAKEKRK
jgi:metallo-beta-lactamase class B